MSLIDRKVNDWSQAVSSLDDKPKMTAASLKAAFDSNSNQLKPAINGIIDDLTGSQGALNIGLTPIDGLSGSNVQAVLQAISLLLKNKDIDIVSLKKLFTSDGASLVGLQPVSGVSASNLQQAIISLADTISKVDPYFGNPVAISQGGTDANDSQNALYNLGCRVRKNYFDNPDFKINQEKAEYNIPISMGKIVDRWYSEGIGNCEYTENGIITNNQYARQMWSSSTITAGKWTVSALCTGDIAVVFGKYGYADIKVNASSTNYDNGLASVTFDIPQSLLNQISYNDYIYIICKSGLGTNKGLLKYVKFEKGETQTLARKLEDGSWERLEKTDYVTELAKCQYYFERVGNDRSEVLTNSVYVPVGAKAVTFIIPFNYKRINPTVSFSELSQYRLLIQFANETNGATSVDIKSFDLISSTKTAAKVTITLADPTPVDGYMVLQRGDNSTAAWIDVSAEF